MDGKTINYFPASAADLMKCQPVYEEMDGWQTETTHIRKFEDLPQQAKDYINRLSELIGCRMNIVCIGPSREQTIEVNPVI